MFYSGAQLFLFPTLYEGFGMPPVEAMACGTPVLASNAPCMPEVLGEAAILSPPDNAERFAEEIVRILSNETLVGELRELGLRRAREFRWEASVSEMLSLFQTG
jgi:glycosyltransferase involved in cell wall biosynthesis